MSLPPFSTVEATNPWSAMWTRTHDADPSYQKCCQRWWSAERCGYFCTPMLAIQQMNAGFFPRCLNTSWLFMFSLFDWLFELFFLGQETLHCMGHCQYEAFSNGQPHPIVDVSGLSDAEIRKLSGNAFWFNLVSVCVCVCVLNTHYMCCHWLVHTAATEFMRHTTVFWFHQSLGNALLCDWGDLECDLLPSTVSAFVRRLTSFLSLQPL